jgi:MoaA/NifB/PqqE/SkfB family radical SAM enzyme
MRVTETFDRKDLSVDTVKRIIDAAARKGVRMISFTGGEPLLRFDDLIELIRYSGKTGIEHIRTGTNGFVFRNSGDPGFESRIGKVAEKLAETPLRNFWISMDSAEPKVHERMRGFPGVVKGIEKALPILHAHGVFPTANLGINRNLSHGTMALTGGAASPPGGESQGRFYEAFIDGFRRFYGLIIDMGFTIASTCYPMDVDPEQGGAGLSPVYGATSKDLCVRFSAHEKALIFKAVYDVVPEFRGRIRIFSPRVSLQALYRQHAHDREMPYACLGGIDYFFVDARDGDTYPCGYRGNENLGKFWDLDRQDRRSARECVRCDWECFRDASELFGPILDLRNDRSGLVRKAMRDPLYRKLWIDDLRYYRDCDWFNGRKPPDLERLRRRWGRMPTGESSH